MSKCKLFISMNNRSEIIDGLMKMNLTKDEATVYVCLTEKPNTHLQVARSTGINRTKVYRIVEQLEARNLVSRRTDDRGMFLIADDPSSLEIQLHAEDAKLKRQKDAAKKVIPQLRSFYYDAKSPFVINSYEGTDGLRQMQWHELKAKGDLLVFGNSTIEDMVIDHHWAEKVRQRVVERGYLTREIYNDAGKKPDFTDSEDYLELYEARRVSSKDLPVATPMIIYNDTVAIYQSIDDKRVGVEIVNHAFAMTMRSIFENYWKTASKIER